MFKSKDIKDINLDQVTIDDAIMLSKQGYVIVLGNGKVIDIKKKEN
jgi:hypothetical protein